MAGVHQVIFKAEKLSIESNYNWQEMTREEVSDLIDELKDRLGYK